MTLYTPWGNLSLEEENSFLQPQPKTPMPTTVRAPGGTGNGYAGRAPVNPVRQAPGDADYSRFICAPEGGESGEEKRADVDLDVF